MQVQRLRDQHREMEAVLAALGRCTLSSYVNNTHTLSCPTGLLEGASPSMKGFWGSAVSHEVRGTVSKLADTIHSAMQ